MTYEEAGVKEVNFSPTFRRNIRATFGATTLMDLGFFANVVEGPSGNKIAITTDGVGSKSEIAKLLGDYTTLGVDCVAMNVNDLLCVGATPISMVDYIAIDRLDSNILDELSIGLRIGAEQAGISIVGGEIAQLPDNINGIELSGTAIGEVDTLIDGSAILGKSESIIGLHSNGLHANGYTLARKVLSTESASIHLLRALLKPTRIYVQPILGLKTQGINILGMAHITGGGWRNILRLKTQYNIEYRINNIWPEPDIYTDIRKTCKIHTKDMFSTFNMGIGFILVVPMEQESRTCSLLDSYGIGNSILGSCHKSENRQITIYNTRFLLTMGACPESGR